MFAKASCQRAARGPHAHLEQPIDRDRSADLVAVRQRDDQDLGAGLAALKAMDV
jgi:hypothetical protein